MNMTINREKIEIQAFELSKHVWLSSISYRLELEFELFVATFTRKLADNYFVNIIGLNNALKA